MTRTARTESSRTGCGSKSSRSIREVVREELKPLTRSGQFFHLAAGAVPIFSAAVLITLQTMSGRVPDTTYNVLLISLIMIGLGGFLLALLGTHQLSRLVSALTGET